MKRPDTLKLLQEIKDSITEEEMRVLVLLENRKHAESVFGTVPLSEGYLREKVLANLLADKIKNME